MLDPSSVRCQGRVGEYRFHPIYRSDPDDDNRRYQRPCETGRLSIAEVEDYVFGCEVDVQANDAAPPQ